MTVHFIGAGPGAPDLITLRGMRLIERCPVCLYAGSLVPREIVAAAPKGAMVIDTAPLHLDQIIELTLPEASQSVILTRTAVRASAMPENERLAALGASGATLAIHLSVNNLARVVRELVPHYGTDCPVVVAYRVSWPDERLLRGTLATIRDRVKEAGITRTALILVGRVLAEGAPAAESRLYAADHAHVLRPRRDMKG